ncbi:unnamed protein product [Medioppia subpectinata]|uniref:Uncharacterized protein n=1 Tax=Medioppia subpectinata TaxID=1979941 RepID=A0A7R9Q830_9ACAR|nr:unnamed protein product [Medioppia subpectinata]CAG2115432.1 unnamed protein product [Medioppia subpectinata]
MDLLLYILAGFGVFSLLLIILKLLVLLFTCCGDSKSRRKHFKPIGDSDVYTAKNSLTIISANEAIEQMDQMLEQYTKPKVVVSRQCICPNCTKEINKIVINDHNNHHIIIGSSDVIDTRSSGSLMADKTLEEVTEEEDMEARDEADGADSHRHGSSVDDDSLMIDMEDILVLDDNRDDMPCNVYNNVVTELKQKFELIITNDHRLRNNTMINPDDLGNVESTDM